MTSNFGLSPYARCELLCIRAGGTIENNRSTGPQGALVGLTLEERHTYGNAYGLVAVATRQPK